MQIRIVPIFSPEPARLSDWRGWVREPSPFWATTELDAWTIAVMLLPRLGQPVAAELRVYPTGTADPGTRSVDPDLVPSGGVPATKLHNFPLGSFITKAIAQLTEPTAQFDDVDDWFDVIDSGGFDYASLLECSVPDKRGRPPLPDELLAAAALLYVRATRQGLKAPVEYVTEKLDDPSIERVRQVVHKARKRGFLTPAPGRGRAGGQITPRAREVLALMRKGQQGRET